MDSGQWRTDEPHVCDWGESAVLMPRLGVDARGNLLLVWAIEGAPTTLAYQRYRAETGAWESIQPIEGASFTDASFATEGKLPFALAPNGVGGLMFRTSERSGQAVKLAQFF